MLKICTRGSIRKYHENLQLLRELHEMIKKKWNKIAICQNVIYYSQSKNNQTTYNFVLLYLSRTSFIPQEN